MPVPAKGDFFATVQAAACLDHDLALTWRCLSLSWTHLEPWAASQRPCLLLLLLPSATLLPLLPLRLSPGSIGIPMGGCCCCCCMPSAVGTRPGGAPPPAIAAAAAATAAAPGIIAAAAAAAAAAAVPGSIAAAGGAGGGGPGGGAGPGMAGLAAADRGARSPTVEGSSGY